MASTGKGRGVFRVEPAWSALAQQAMAATQSSLWASLCCPPQWLPQTNCSMNQRALICVNVRARVACVCLPLCA